MVCSFISRLESLSRASPASLSALSGRRCVAQCPQNLNAICIEACESGGLCAHLKSLAGSEVHLAACSKMRNPSFQGPLSLCNDELYWKIKKLSMEVHAFNPYTQEAESDRCLSLRLTWSKEQIPGQPRQKPPPQQRITTKIWIKQNAFSKRRFVYLYFEVRSHCVARAGLQLLIFLPQQGGLEITTQSRKVTWKLCSSGSPPPKSWGYRSGPPHLA